MAIPPWDPPVVEVGRWCALQPEDEADRDGGRHQAAHGYPDEDLLPRSGHETEQEEAQRPLRYRHADDGKGLTYRFEEDRTDKLVYIGYIGHVLAEAVVRRYRGRGTVADEEGLKRASTVSKHAWSTLECPSD